MHSDPEMEPIDPDYKPAKSLEQLAAEHTDWVGLNQLAQAEREGGLWSAKRVLH